MHQTQRGLGTVGLPHLDGRGQENQVPQQARGLAAQRPVFALAPLCLASFVSVPCWVGAASGKHQMATQLVSRESWPGPAQCVPRRPGEHAKREVRPQGLPGLCRAAGSRPWPVPPASTGAALNPRFSRKDKPCWISLI